jgi:hypothetical protein
MIGRNRDCRSALGRPMMQEEPDQYPFPEFSASNDKFFE